VKTGMAPARESAVRPQGRRRAKPLCAAVLVLGLLCACQRNPSARPTQVGQEPLTASPTATPSPSPTVALTATPSATEMPTRTHTPTTTPTTTSTPTPTALPAWVEGNLRELQIHAPEPAAGARCGLVDIFDFPLDSPDGANARGGTDFGIYRRRYLAFHAGEDWGRSSGSSFGAPVTSIGHGIVTYAHPDGWGADRGVVVVRHTLPGGSTMLSFYGHLDPPSVVLRAGDCVARGELVGTIGRPRTSPHLHFEIRTHLPDGPGRGYSDADPTLGGWLPPSETIWYYRMASLPGVVWVQQPESPNVQPIGAWTGATLMVVLDGQLAGLHLQDGRTRWKWPEMDRIDAATMSADGDLLLVADQAGKVTALRPSDTTPPLDRVWEADSGTVGVPWLAPLPDGGVLIATWNRMAALSSSGESLWLARTEGIPERWVPVGDGLLLSGRGWDGDLWLADAVGLRTLVENLSGIPVNTGGQVWLYAEDGVYRLDLVSGQTTRVYPLSRAYWGLGDAVAWDGKGLLVAHRDTRDTRLILLNGFGEVEWERSVGAVLPGQPLRWIIADRPYLLHQAAANNGLILRLLAVEPGSDHLTQVWYGGSRDNSATVPGALRLDDQRVLISFGSTSTLVDLAAAYETLVLPSTK